MANGRIRSSEPSALGVRVDNLADDVHGFRSDLQGIRGQMATKDEISNLAAAIAGLTSKYDAARAPNWQALGVAITVLSLIGGILYLPIREATQDLKATTLRQELQTQDNRVALGKIEEQVKFLERRYDAISSRLAEFIRAGK